MPNESHQEIPLHHSPVRQMWAEAHGRAYAAFRDLAEARRHPEAVMIMETDFGGQILASCPVRLIAAGEAALNQLLCDLASITWGGGGLAEDTQPNEDSRIYFEAVSIGAGIAGGMRGGLAVDGLWIHDELAELGLTESIEDVLRGKSGRITLSTVASFLPFVSISEARKVRGARLLFTQSGNGWAGAFLSCDVARIRCGEQPLAELLHDLGMIARGEAHQVKWSRIYKLDVSRYQFVRGLERVYNNSHGAMVLYVSPTGSGIHPGLRSPGPHPEIWLGGGLDQADLIGRVSDVLDGRSPRIDLSGLRRT